jgi:endonuclease G
MATRHFPQSQLDEIRTAVLELIGYDPMTRNALIAPLPASLKGLLPGGMAPPAIGLTLDLDHLNRIERLTDGSVPLKQFLEKAVGFAGILEAADVIRSALAEIEAGTTGAPPVNTAGLPEIHEAVILRDDMVPFGFLRGGITAAAAVAKLMVPRHEDGVPVTTNGKPVIHLGTGWLVASGLLVTNPHVVNARNQGEPAAGEADLLLQSTGMSVLFDYDDNTSEGTHVDPTELIAWDPDLDYALVRITDTTRAPLRRAAAITQVSPGSAIAVNVIQHPDGHAKRFGIRNNLLTGATPTELRYFTDTLGGSSGSPVLNDRWEVVGLHRGSAFVSGVKFQGRSVAYVNVGTQISAVLEHVREQHAGKVAELGI